MRRKYSKLGMVLYKWPNNTEGKINFTEKKGKGSNTYTINFHKGEERGLGKI